MRQRLQAVHNLLVPVLLGWLGLLTCGPLAVAAQAEISVEAELSPPSFTLDQTARLTITVYGTTSNGAPVVPRIDHLRLIGQGTSSQISVTSGDISSSISHNYLVQADQAGSYTIPAIEVVAEGRSYTTEPISFQVTPAPGQPGGYGVPADQGRSRLAFLRISPVGSHYLGELVPFTIKAYFTQAYRADIKALPTLQGDGVVMAQLSDKPRQGSETVAGMNYHVLTWQTNLTGIKAGAHPFRLSLDATMLIPQKRRLPSRFNRGRLFDDPLFDDSAFDSLFGGVKPEPITAVSPEAVFTVLPLPTDHQPAGFTGAIGDFELQVSAAPLEVEVGEPLTLTMQITGTGNFDRVDAPSFPAGVDWRTYPPTAAFSDTGAGASGTKTFEQAIVARNGTLTEIPPLSFCYFNPVQKRYLVASSQPIPIRLTQPEAPAAAATSPPPVSAQTQPSSQPESAAPGLGLAPIHLETGTFHQRIVPLYRRAWPLAIVLLCLLMLTVLLVLRLRRRRLDHHPELLRQRESRRQLDHDLARLAEALATGDSRLFLAAARAAIRNQFGPRWGIEPAALSQADLKSRLPADSPLLGLFSAAESAAYGGAILTGQQMAEYAAELTRELRRLP